MGIVSRSGGGGGGSSNGGTITDELIIDPAASTAHGSLEIDSPDSAGVGGYLIHGTNGAADTTLEAFSDGHLRLQAQGDTGRILEVLQVANAAATGWLVYAQAKTGSRVGGVGQNGELKMSNVISAPTDASLTAGQLALWFDATNGAAKAMFKGKTLDGTVVSASVPMA